jgi:DNA-binding NarL/FixJ family response regulator
MAPHRILIVDDHAAFRAAARRMLEAAGFVVVAEAEDAASAYAAADATNPEIALLDIHLPGADGITIAAQLATRANPPCIVLISSRDADNYGERLTRAPVRGFIPKSELTGPALAALVA